MSQFEFKLNVLFDLTWTGSIYWYIRLSYVQIVETTTPDTRYSEQLYSSACLGTVNLMSCWSWLINTIYRVHWNMNISLEGKHQSEETGENRYITEIIMTVTITVNGNMSQFLAVTDPRLGEIKSKTQIFDSIREVPSYTDSEPQT